MHCNQNHTDTAPSGWSALPLPLSPAVSDFQALASKGCRCLICAFVAACSTSSPSFPESPPNADPDLHKPSLIPLTLTDRRSSMG